MSSDLAELGWARPRSSGWPASSGSGKSMTTLAVLGLAHTVGARVSGSIRLDGAELTGLSQRELREVRGRRIAAIFQSPAMAFSPVFQVGSIVHRALRLHGMTKARGSRARPRGRCAQVLLPPGLLDRYPSQLSGGQLQRVAIALALALRAEVLLADEPTSALDVTVQAEVLELLRELRDRERMSVLFISHDLAVVAELCDRVAIMQDGPDRRAGPHRPSCWSRAPAPGGTPHTRPTLLAAACRRTPPGSAGPGRRPRPTEQDDPAAAPAEQTARAARRRGRGPAAAAARGHRPGGPVRPGARG